MITLMILTALFMAGGVYLGASVVFLAVMIVFKLAWFGVRLVFSLGFFAVICAFIALIVLVHLIPVLIVGAGIAALAVLGVGIIAKIFGGGRRPAQSYANDYRGATRPGSSIREATLQRLDATLRRMERRADDLESELGRYH